MACIRSFPYDVVSGINFARYDRAVADAQGLGHRDDVERGVLDDSRATYRRARVAEPVLKISITERADTRPSGKIRIDRPDGRYQRK